MDIWKHIDLNLFEMKQKIENSLNKICMKLMTEQTALLSKFRNREAILVILCTRRNTTNAPAKIKERSIQEFETVVQNATQLVT